MVALVVTLDSSTVNIVANTTNFETLRNTCDPPGLAVFTWPFRLSISVHDDCNTSKDPVIASDTEPSTSLLTSYLALLHVIPYCTVTFESIPAK